MEYLFIYLLQLAKAVENLQIVCIIFAVIMFAVLILAVCYTIDCRLGWSQEDCEGSVQDITALKIRKLFLKLLCVFVFAAGLLSLVPTEKTLTIIGGVYLGKKAVAAASIDTKLDKVNAIVEYQLDKYLKEIKPSND